MQQPLPETEGGLGYYNLTSKATRAQQADLAKKHGIYGFMMYHYWFGGPQAPRGHKVMQRVPELLLEDGEPNINFFLSWANEPWTSRWDGGNHDVLIGQEYGGPHDWTEHFNYLLNFFKHANYVKFAGRPVFAIYRLGHFQTKLCPMLTLWMDLARKNGFPGLHFVATMGKWWKQDSKQLETCHLVKAGFHFAPGLETGGVEELKHRSATTQGLAAYHVKDQYWGSFTSFDRSPRVMMRTPHRTPGQFNDSMQCSFCKIAQSASQAPRTYFFVAAWNEWAEQCVLEPDNINKFGFLEALKFNIDGYWRWSGTTSCPVCMRTRAK